MPSNDEREKAAEGHLWSSHKEPLMRQCLLCYRPMMIDSKHFRTEPCAHAVSPLFASLQAEVQQLREERDVEKFLCENAMKNLRVSAEHVTELLAERDRYAAVIEEALHGIFAEVTVAEMNGFAGVVDRLNAIASALASVDSGSVLAERDAEKWDEGMKATYRHIGRVEDAQAAGQGVMIPDLVNPYRAEQIRKEGKSNETA